MKTSPKESSSAMPDIFQHIEVLEKRLKQFQEQTLKDAGLTPPQYFILSLLNEQDGRSFKEVAQALGCTPATVTGIVDTMEKKELVARRPNPPDRRSLQIKITTKGQALVTATPGLEKIFGECCCDVLPPAEIRELNRLLKKLSDSLPF